MMPASEAQHHRRATAPAAVRPPLQPRPLPDLTLSYTSTHTPRVTPVNVFLLSLALLLSSGVLIRTLHPKYRYRANLPGKTQKSSKKPKESVLKNIIKAQEAIAETAEKQVQTRKAERETSTGSSSSPSLSGAVSNSSSSVEKSSSQTTLNFHNTVYCVASTSAAVIANFSNVAAQLVSSTFYSPQRRVSTKDSDEGIDELTDHEDFTSGVKSRAGSVSTSNAMMNGLPGLTVDTLSRKGRSKKGKGSNAPSTTSPSLNSSRSTSIYARDSPHGQSSSTKDMSFAVVGQRQTNMVEIGVQTVEPFMDVPPSPLHLALAETSDLVSDAVELVTTSTPPRSSISRPSLPYNLHASFQSTPPASIRVSDLSTIPPPLRSPLEILSNTIESYSMYGDGSREGPSYFPAQLCHPSLTVNTIPTSSQGLASLQLVDGGRGSSPERRPVRHRNLTEDSDASSLALASPSIGRRVSDTRRVSETRRKSGSGNSDMTGSQTEIRQVVGLPLEMGVGAPRKGDVRNGKEPSSIKRSASSNQSNNGDLLKGRVPDAPHRLPVQIASIAKNDNGQNSSPAQQERRTSMTATMNQSTSEAVVSLSLTPGPDLDENFSSRRPSMTQGDGKDAGHSSANWKQELNEDEIKWGIDRIIGLGVNLISNDGSIGGGGSGGSENRGSSERNGLAKMGESSSESGGERHFDTTNGGSTDESRGVSPRPFESASQLGPFHRQRSNSDYFVGNVSTSEYARSIQSSPSSSHRTLPSLTPFTNTANNGSGSLSPQVGTPSQYRMMAYPLPTGTAANELAQNAVSPNSQYLPMNGGSTGSISHPSRPQSRQSSLSVPSMAGFSQFSSGVTSPTPQQQQQQAYMQAQAQAQAQYQHAVALQYQASQIQQRQHEVQQRQLQEQSRQSFSMGSGSNGQIQSPTSNWPIQSAGPHTPGMVLQNQMNLAQTVSPTAAAFSLMYPYYSTTPGGSYSSASYSNPLIQQQQQSHLPPKGPTSRRSTSSKKVSQSPRLSSSSVDKSANGTTAMPSTPGTISTSAVVSESTGWKVKLRTAEMEADRAGKELEIARWKLAVMEDDRVACEMENQEALAALASRAQRAEKRVKFLENVQQPDSSSASGSGSGSPITQPSSVNSIAEPPCELLTPLTVDHGDAAVETLPGPKIHPLAWVDLESVTFSTRPPQSRSHTLSPSLSSSRRSSRSTRHSSGGDYQPLYRRRSNGSHRRRTVPSPQNPAIAFNDIDGDEDEDDLEIVLDTPLRAAIPFEAFSRRSSNANEDELLSSIILDDEPFFGVAEDVDTSLVSGLAENDVAPAVHPGYTGSLPTFLKSLSTGPSSNEETVIFPALQDIAEEGKALASSTSTPLATDEYPLDKTPVVGSSFDH